MATALLIILLQAARAAARAQRVTRARPAMRPNRTRLPLGSLLVVVPALYVGLMALYVHGLGQPPFMTVDVGMVLSAWRAVPLFALRLLSLGTIRLLCDSYFPTWMAAPPVWYLVTALVTAGVLYGVRMFAVTGGMHRYAA